MIHFTRINTKNYAGVQDQIFGLIQMHLPEGSWTDSNEYVEGALNFSIFTNKKSDVLMSHGVADKNYHFRKHPEDRSLRLNHTQGRTDLLVPGPWLQRRIAKSKHLNYDETTVHVVGWPRLDPFFSDGVKVTASASDTSRRKRVLWAPTHDFVRRGDGEERLSSYPAFEPFFEKLSENYDTAVSLHPRNRKDKAPTGMALADADVVITDFGTMVYEAVALGKQVIFPTWIVGQKLKKYNKRSAENVIFLEEIGLHAHSFEEMCEMIDSGTTMDERANAFFEDYLPAATYGNSGKLVAEVLMRLAQNTHTTTRS